MDYITAKGYRELKKVYKSLTENKVLKRYLSAFFVYSMAVQTVMLVATYFGEQEIDWGSENQKTIGLISSILIIQLVAILGAQLTSLASGKFGNITTLIIINGIWAVLCVIAFFMTSPIQFYITAGFVGMVMGGIQALSRSTYSKFLPKTKDTASYFSFYDVSEKIGIVIGMLIYGFIDQYTGSMRNSIVFLMLFFEILANSRSRDREESIPIDLDPFRPNLTYFISIYFFSKKHMSIFFSFPHITHSSCLPGRLRPL